MRKSARFRVKSCRFAAQPLSTSLQGSIRFLRTPLPASPTAFLAISLPSFGQQYGLTVFRVVCKDGLGSAYSPVVVVSVPSQSHGEGPTTFPFWVRPVSVFGPFGVDGVQQQFTYVNHIVQPSALSALTLADVCFPHGSHTACAELHCPEGFTRSRYQLRMLQ